MDLGLYLNYLGDIMPLTVLVGIVYGIVIHYKNKDYLLL